MAVLRLVLWYLVLMLGVLKYNYNVPEKVFLLCPVPRECRLQANPFISENELQETDLLLRRGNSLLEIWFVDSVKLISNDYTLSNPLITFFTDTRRDEQSNVFTTDSVESLFALGGTDMFDSFGVAVRVKRWVNDNQVEFRNGFYGVQ